MMIKKDTCKLALVQAAPVMFDKDRCVEKITNLIGEAAAKGAELVVFPELFIPGYPYGMTYGFTVGSRSRAGREDWKTYYDNSILADGAEMQSIVDCAKEHSVYVSVGYSERDAVTATLYNSNIMIAPDGQTMNHRKLKPTGSERVIWGDADKDFFPVMETPWGPMGNLICWESYMPLARRRELRSIFPRIRMTMRSGRIRSAISPSRDTASSSMRICILRRTCTRRPPAVMRRSRS